VKPGLQRILQRKRMDVAAYRLRVSMAEMEAEARRGGPVRDFRAALRNAPGLAIIAELKRASPSAGLLRSPYDVAGGALAYERAGAAALSVITEKNFFKGSLAHIAEAKRATRLPVLRKDFILDAYQVAHARAAGADACLLIVAALSGWRLPSLVREVKRWGMTPVVEAHDEAELDAAVASGAEVIGVNSRNLKDLTVDTRLFKQLLPKVPKDRLAVAESGLKDAADIRALAGTRADAALVGESLLRQRDLEAAARALVEAGRA
jgi:indole-3-glycerol phosphate synthase